MATPVSTNTNSVGGDDICFLVSYPMTTADHTGLAVERPQWYDRVLVATGTWGGATLILEGSNDGTNFVPLKDANGTAISLTADGTFHLLGTPRFVRPRLSVVGAGATITATLLCRRPTDMRV